MITVTPNIKAIWPVLELPEFRAIHLRSSAQIITMTWESILSLAQAANLSWLNQFQTGRMVRDKPVLLYWPKSVPQSSSHSLKLRITLGVGNTGLFKVTLMVWPW